MLFLRRLARRVRRAFRPRQLPDTLTAEQLAGALADAASPAQVRALIARVRPPGPHSWPAVARHSPEWDIALIDQLLAEDPASAPELARNPNLTAGEYGHLAQWAAGRLARDAAGAEQPAYLAPAPLALERLADAGHLRFDDPAARTLMQVGRQTAEAHRTHLDRDARRILLRMQDLSAADLVVLTDVCRSDEEALLAIARHPAATRAVWQAILVATPRASTAERLAEVPAIRQDPMLRALLHRRHADSAALLVALAAVAEGDEYRELWLDLVRADRVRAAAALRVASDAAIGSLTRRDLVALLHSPVPAESDAALATLRRLGIDPAAGEMSAERRAG
jgi:hypothetical protein